MELRVGAGLLLALLVVGTLLGPLWQAISPRTVGYVAAAHTVIPDENEALIATDARFVMLTGAVGVLTAVLMWTRVPWRGPTVVAALAFGGLLGALATALVGGWTGGGTVDGAVRSVVTLPVAVRAHGLLLVEALLAVTVYGVLVLFASSDDLGRTSDDLGRTSGSERDAAVDPIPTPPDG